MTAYFCGSVTFFKHNLHHGRREKTRGRGRAKIGVERKRGKEGVMQTDIERGWGRMRKRVSKCESEWGRERDSIINQFPDLLFLWCLGSRTVVGLLEQELFHFAVLQVVQLPHCILGSQDQVHQNRIWPLPLYKCMLGKGGQRRSLTTYSGFLICPWLDNYFWFKCYPK